MFRNEIEVRDFNLAMTLDSGQAFRWRRVAVGTPGTTHGHGAMPPAAREASWVGIVAGRWVQLDQDGSVLRMQSMHPPEDGWRWLVRYLGLDHDLETILQTFPGDPPMLDAVKSCRGLRLLRQPAWECLASFICSSTKQIVQIQEIVSLLASRFGEPIPAPPGASPAFAFPTPGRIAAATEAGLRECKLGFRAPYLQEAARRITAGQLDLDRLGNTVQEARDRLMTLPGVGPKIANCVLLFAYGFQSAFPIDVWVRRALHQLYFPRARRVATRRLESFSSTHFGPYSGYAQQYLFHYVRTGLASQRILPLPPGRRRRK